MGIDSRAREFAELFRPLGLDVALRVGRATWRQLSVEERALITADWGFWARPNQLPPPGDWKTWGFLAARGVGKTISLSNFVNSEVEAGRAPLVCLLAQDEQSSVDLQVNGPSGLIATAPPWFKPTWEASALQLVWPNGSRAYVRTPEVPGKIRGLEYHLTWASELQSWPKSTMDEAFYGAMFPATRLGAGRIVWDATPKKRHPLLRELLTASETSPKLHVVVRGATRENAANLAAGYVDDLERKYAGTQRGREELLGEMLEDSDLALVRQAWIDETRRECPSSFLRRVVSIDPAVSDRPGSDTTGLVEVGLGLDDRAYILWDGSGKQAPGKWADLVLDRYVNGGCDLVIGETNKGGQLVTHTLRAAAHARGLEVIVVEKDAKPRRVAGKVWVKEVYARGAKEERAEPVATAYERRRISHVRGADLASLEDTLTTWEPDATAKRYDSPGDLDALVHAVVELLGLSNNTPDPVVGFQGLSEAAKQIAAPTPQRAITVADFGSFGRDDHI